MPDLINLYEIAQESGHHSVYVSNDRCVPVQHRRSSCRRCIEGCPAEAIEYDNRKLKVDNALCVGCGVCATVCPTEAIVSLDPLEDDLRESAAASVKHNGGVACIACARVAAREDIDEAQYAEVPCLSRVNESVLVELVAAGATRVVLVDGGCKNCKYRDCDNVTQEVVAGANYLLAGMGSDLRVERLQAFPTTFAKRRQEKVGESRRAAFEEAGASTKGMLGRAARVVIRRERSQNQASAMVLNMLGVDEGSEYVPVAPRRQERLLDALFAIGEANGVEFALPDEDFGSAVNPAQADSGDGASDMAASNGEAALVESGDGASPEDPSDKPAEVSPAEETSVKGPALDTRYFGMVQIDREKCNKCGICAVVCKQDALKRVDGEVPGIPDAFFEFTPANCVQCQLCNEACFRKAITVESATPLDALFSFDPVYLQV